MNYRDAGGQPVLLARLRYPESTWGEEILLYVHRIEEGYSYEAEDYYGNELLLSPAFSVQPLTLQALIRLIETIEPGRHSSSGNLGLTLLGIPEARSEFYLQLGDYFREKREKYGLE